MCRFALYLGSPLRLKALLTEPENSIIHQSIHSHEGAQTVNGDGFGVAWYAPELSDRPGLFTAISPAWNNRNLLSLSEITRSGCIVAHVRAATPGLPVTQLNCHPFVWERLAFMHNGAVAGFGAIRRRLLDRLSDEAYAAIHGSTDTEHLFGLSIDHYRSNAATSPVERLAAALTSTIQQVEEMSEAAGETGPSYLNLALADGECAAVSRYFSGDPEQANTLYFAKGGRYFCDGEGSRMEPAYGDTTAVIVASEPLNEGPRWHRVPGNHLVLVDSDQEVELRPIAEAA
jgi:predicted glutamine amidotransferase